MKAWIKIETTPPSRYVTVLLCRAGDLYPVVGCVIDFTDDRGGPRYMLEEGGAEDGPDRTYPLLHWQPTHWLPLSSLPGVPTVDEVMT